MTSWWRHDVKHATNHEKNRYNIHTGGKTTDKRLRDTSYITLYKQRRYIIIGKIKCWYDNSYNIYMTRGPYADVTRDDVTWYPILRSHVITSRSTLADPPPPNTRCWSLPWLCTSSRSHHLNSSGLFQGPLWWTRRLVFWRPRRVVGCV